MPFSATADQRAIHGQITLDRDQTSVQNGFKWSDIKIFRDYSNGKHAVTLTEKSKEILRNLLGNRFCDNVCHQIISESTGRVNFVGWKCANETVKNWLDEFYRLARIKNRQSDVHYRSQRDGNFVLAVNWDPKSQRVQVYKEDWWDGTQGVYIHYNDADEPDYAVKEWKKTRGVPNLVGQVTVTTTWYRTIWFEDRVERWTKADGGSDNSWIPAPLDDDLIPDESGEAQQTWPMPWLDDNGEPIGIPYVHFPNVSRTYGNYGVSELDGGVIGFQDQLNDGQFQLSINTRFTGGQMYYGTGFKPKNKEGTNEPLPVKTEPGAFFTSPNEKSTFGTLAAGDPTAIIKSYEVKLKAVSRITATPLHAITGGDWPSGDALLRAELPAVNKAKKQIGQYQDSWVTVAVLAMKINNVFKPSSQPEINYDIKNGIVEAVFDDPEKRDAISRSIIVHNLTGFIGSKEALRIMDYSEEQVEKVYEEKQEEDQATADNLASTLATRATGAGKGAAGSGGNNKKDANPA